MNTTAVVSSVKPSSREFEERAIHLLISLVLLTMLGGFLGAGQVVRLFFILASAGAALYLYTFSVPAYISFTLWIWFLAPFLRRFVDLHSGFDGLGIMIVAPFVVTTISGIRMIRGGGKIFQPGSVDFLLPLVAIIYAFIVGVLNNPMMAVFRASLDWFPPVLFGLYLSLNWRIYPEIRRSLQTTFAWGLLIMGCYGIYQYMVAPPWDVYWMERVQLGSIGRPVARGMRVWSTMNAPGPYASVASAGVLLLLSHRPTIFLPSYITGFLSLLLSSVRAAWVGWAVAQLMLFTSIKSKFQIRLILIGAVLALMLVPLSMAGPFQDEISARVSSLFGNISSDSSFQARSATYENNLWPALSSVIGKGLGGTFSIGDSGGAVKVALDSGVLDIFFTLGWVGALPFLIGLFMLFSRQLKSYASRSDVFMSAARSISAANVIQLAFGNTATGIGGLMLWGFLGVSVAAHKYHSAEFRRASWTRLSRQSELNI